MGPIFGLFVLVIIAVALYNRRRERRTLVAEEHREESGAWIDKRAGERGTYGSLDAEREAERHTITRQGRISDAVLDMRNTAINQFPGFNERSDEQIKTFATAARTQVTQFFNLVEPVKNGQLPEIPASLPAEDDQTRVLKKIMLQAAYAQFPWLLDQDIEVVKQLDRLAASLVGTLPYRAG